MIFKARVKSLNKISTSIFELVLVHDEDLFYFNAGQYVWIETKYGRRAFSIASSSKYPKELKINFKAGIESDYMNYLSILKNGDAVTLIGPRGVLRAPESNTESIYLAGGVGITPFLSIIRSLKDNGLSRKITLISVFSSEDQSIFVDELKGIAKSDSDFKFVNIFGKIDESVLAKIRKSNPDAGWCVIGSQTFVDASSSILKSLQVDEKNISFEENFPNNLKLNMNFNSEEFFKKITDQSAIHVIITDINGKVTYANQSAEKMTGYKASQMIGNTPRLWGGLMDGDVYRNFWQTIKVNKKVYIGEFKNIRANGDEYDVLATVSPILEGDTLVGFLGMEQDITEDKRNREELKKIRDLMVDRVLEKDKKL